MKRHIHVHVHDAKWEESKHPRDKGKFASAPGGSKKLNLDDPKERSLAERLLARENAAAKDANSPEGLQKRAEQLRQAVKEDPKDERLRGELNTIEEKLAKHSPTKSQGMALSKQDKTDLQDAVESLADNWRDDYGPQAKRLKQAHDKMLKGEALTEGERDLVREAIYQRNKEADEEDHAQRLSNLYDRFKKHHGMK